MRDFFAAVSIVPLAAVGQADASFWERMAERWGIALVCAILYWLIFKRANKREDDASAAAILREATALKLATEREQASNSERIALLSRNNEILELHLKGQKDHGNRLEKLVSEGNKTTQDYTQTLNNLIRKMRRPCVAPFEPSANDQE